jgi:uncharacterized protein YbjT (DUF2867 family)
LCAEEGVAKFIHVSALGACKDSPSEYYRSKAAGEAAVKAAFPMASIGDPRLNACETCVLNKTKI